MPAALPSGTVTFLFTDIEGSTKLLQQLGDRYAQVLGEHQHLLRRAFADHAGVEVDTQGDSFFVAFPTAPAAVTAAVAATRALAEHPWPEGAALRVRMGLHTGSPQLVGDRYVGIDVHRAARIAAAGHGGQVLLSPTTRELVASALPAGTIVRDLGRYQLKDFPQPEHLYQLVLAGLPDTFPRLKTLDRPPRDLPPRAPGFVGREADIDALTTALRSSQAVAVIGMGGLGKSSLAAEAVHTLAADPAVFPSGVAWVRCDERTELLGLVWILDQLLVAWESSLSAEATARATSLEEGVELRERALQKRLGSEGSSSPAPALVLLDNVESELPLARLLETVTPLGLTTLLTRRSEPSSPRVHLLRLEVLAPEEGIRLFAERFVARGGKWRAERDEVDTRTIVQALGGLPLAIELASARAARTGIPLPSLAEELGTSGVLARLSDPLDPSASVRYSLGRTLTSLTASQRVRFAALGLPEGQEWPLPIVEHMLADVSASVLDSEQQGTTVHTDLEAFVAYSLVGLVPAGGDAGRGTAPCVRLHPLVRELAREEWAQLPAPEQDAALGGLLAGVRAWLARHQGSSQRAIETLAQDEELIAGAVREAVVRQIELPQVIAIVEAWWDYLSVRNPLLGGEMARLQLQCARTIGDRRAEVAALRGLAGATFRAGQQNESTAYRQAALAIAREIGDQVAMLGQLSLLGATAANRGERAEAERMYEEASAIARELGDRLTDSVALHSLGDLARAMGRFEEAERWYLRAVESTRAAGDILAEGPLQTTLGLLYEQMGDTAAAQRIYEEWLLFGRAYGHLFGTGILLNALGQLALRDGDLEAAARDLTEAQPYLEQIGFTVLVVQVRGNLAILAGLEAQRRGDHEAATRAFEEALRLFDQNRPLVSLHATDQRPFVRQLLAEVHDHPAGNAPAGTLGAPTSPTLRVRRRWWPWGRNERPRS